MSHSDPPQPRRTLNRRAFLYAAGTTGLALPFLEGLPERSAFAQAATKPVFGLFICTANGVVMASGNEPERFWPTALGSLTTASMNAFAEERCTGILAEHAARLLIVRGLRYPANLSGCGHAQGLVQCLTAAAPTGSANQATSTGPSVDTVIAEAVNPVGVAPLTLYSGMKGGYIDEKLSFSGPGQVRAAEGNPYNVYQRMTGLRDVGSGGDDDAARRLFERRESVNDLVIGQIRSLRANSALSSEDQKRLELHFDTIREVENTITDMADSCSREFVDMTALEAINTGAAFRQNGRIEEVAKLHMDLVGLTFACNANRVATLQIGDGTDGTRYTIDGQTVERFHWISHRIASDGSTGAAIPQALEWHIAIDRIRMNTFKYLLDKWSQYQTPHGPLLDNAFALWTSHVSQGPSHSFTNLPILIAGSAGGHLKQGQYVDGANASNGRLLNTLLVAMGVQGKTVGSDPGTLSAVEA